MNDRCGVTSAEHKQELQYFCIHSDSIDFGSGLRSSNTLRAALSYSFQVASVPECILRRDDVTAERLERLFDCSRMIILSLYDHFDLCLLLSVGCVCLFSNTIVGTLRLFLRHMLAIRVYFVSFNLNECPRTDDGNQSRVRRFGPQPTKQAATIRRNGAFLCHPAAWNVRSKGGLHVDDFARRRRFMIFRHCAALRCDLIYLVLVRVSRILARRPNGKRVPRRTTNGITRGCVPKVPRSRIYRFIFRRDLYILLRISEPGRGPIRPTTKLLSLRIRRRVGDLEGCQVKCTVTAACSAR